MPGKFLLILSFVFGCFVNLHVFGQSVIGTNPNQVPLYGVFEAHFDSAGPFVNIELPPGVYDVRWFDPKSGHWYADDKIGGGQQKLSLPKTVLDRRGDWVMLLQRNF